GAPTRSGPAPYEMCTPTGAALLAAISTGWGPMPELRVQKVGMGAGGRSLEEIPNVLRLVLGEPATAGATEIRLEANVDDLDPRIWPVVLERLHDAGAADAWLAPIVMKKGRPAHTVHVLTPARNVAAIRDVLFRHTSTIGLRQYTVDKVALDREYGTVVVDGQEIQVKIARHNGDIVNVSVEYDDVRRASEITDLPVKYVLSAATAAAHEAFPLH
ncbi:MAG TPA: LarC family nickel insertion protein, partial [Mycobacteriales bacterium]|nr:LarC family nickel insertion protein [Mycobacteriales bacterium]